MQYQHWLECHTRLHHSTAALPYLTLANTTGATRLRQRSTTQRHSTAASINKLSEELSEFWDDSSLTFRQLFPVGEDT